MTSGRDFVVISSIDWDFLWQTPQEIACRLARAGNRVLYFETTGVRTPRLGDARRIVKRIAKWTRAAASRGVREVARDVYVCSPLVLPPVTQHWQRALNQSLLVPLVLSSVRKLRMSDAMLWTFLPTDTTLDLLRAMATPQSAVVYHCISDFTRLASNPVRVAASEQELLRTSDLVLAMCSRLAQHCRRWANNVHVLPPGVDLTRFTPDDDGPGQKSVPLSDAALLQTLPRPVIGYVGGLHRHVDVGLLVQAILARSEWSWVFVGPRQSDVDALARLPNVHLLGRRPHHELAKYIDAFDVCIVPYVLNSFTETVVPIKISEYLAMGKPVVSTAMPIVSELNGGSEDAIIEAAPGADGFIAAIERALSQASDGAMRERRRAVAAQHDWDRQFGRAVSLLDAVLRHREAGRA